jgi:hypothetical protein
MTTMLLPSFACPTPTASAAEIVWVVGYQIAEPFKVHPGTSRTVSLHWSQQPTR